MLVESGMTGGFDESDLRKGPVLNVGEILRHGRETVGLAGWNGLSPLEILDVTQSQKALRRGICGARSIVCIDINLPRDTGVLQFLKNCGRGKQRLIGAVGTNGIHVSLRSGGQKIFTIGRGARHSWGKPAI